MKNSLKKLMLISTIFLIPFILLIFSYFIFDPFKVLYTYQNYYEDFYIEPNRDFVSVETYLKNKDNFHYKSFMFGSSRLMAWHTKSWEKFIADTNAFHFDAYKDNLLGIYSKINLINGVGDKLENVLLVIDYDVLSDLSDTTSRLFMKHHIYSERSKIQFHLFFLKEFLNSNFFVEYFDFKFFRKHRNYMKQIDLNQKYGDSYSNDFFIYNLDKQLKDNPEKYYSHQKFPERDTIQLFYNQTIYEAQLKYLTEIKTIFEKQKTDYKIVISPNYDQKKLCNQDLEKLFEIFGQQNIYDFSGINRFTNLTTNYYDFYHHRTQVADSILNIIYLK